MQKRRRTAQFQQQSSSEPQHNSAKTSNGVTQSSTRQDPYSTHHRPTPEECRTVRDQLLSLHGFPTEFAKYRELRRNRSCGSTEFDAEESILDGLVKTLLSQNTTDVNSQRAFVSLKRAFPAWEDVLAADTKCIEDAIRCGGLAPKKASCIKNILNCLLEKRGKLCLEYLRNFSVDDTKAELSQFKGIGPKTVACLLMFYLQKDDFPVDTHVFEISKAIGWIPATADRNKAYLHLNHWIPEEYKFDLNCLLFTHGKLCHECTKKGGKRLGKDSHNKLCPLLNYCNNL